VTRDPELGRAPWGVHERRLPWRFDYRVELRPGEHTRHQEYPAAAGGYSFDLEGFLYFEGSLAVGASALPTSGGVPVLSVAVGMSLVGTGIVAAMLVRRTS
jgi:hypothetical protein